MIKQILLYVMAVFYATAGINHFINPKFYLRIIPSWLPFPEILNYASGALEVIFAFVMLPNPALPLLGHGLTHRLQINR